MNKNELYQLKKYLFKRMSYSSLLVMWTIIALTPGSSWAVDITLGWDANTETDLAGYIIHYGTGGGVYSDSIDVGNTTQYTLTNLQDGVDYFLAVTAYDFNNSESDYSAEVVYTDGDSNKNPTTPAVPNGPTRGNPQTDYSFSAAASDPDGDDLDYRYDWGDGTVSDWGLASQSHEWSSSGNFCIKAQAQDIYGANSNWSSCASVSINVESHTISASAGAHGKIVPAGSVPVANGGSQSFSITANQNYQILDVLVDGVSIGALSSYSFDNVAANHTIIASFVSVNQAPIANAGSDQTVTEGATVTVVGSGSSDPDDGIASYRWSQTGGSPVTLSDPLTVNPTFVTPPVDFTGDILAAVVHIHDLVRLG